MDKKNLIKNNNDLVVKGNDLIQASYNLSLTEQRLILLAIVEAREKGIDANTHLTVYASTYAAQFGVTRQSAYQALKMATDTLFERQVTFYDTKPETGKLRRNKTRWVSKVAYIEDEASVELVFAPDVVPEIIRLEANFTSYELEQVAELQSAYAVRLYELLIQWRSASKTPLFKLEVFRDQLGLGVNEYKAMGDFKKRILDLAISQINKHTDIMVSYDQIKDGRNIVGFIFHLKSKKPKPKKDDDQTPSTLESKKIETPSVTANKKERTPKEIKIDPRFDEFLALPLEQQEQLRNQFTDSLGSPLKEMWKKCRADKMVNPEFKPMFASNFLSMLERRGVA
jgi:plasmid replication initiation protein